MSCTEVKSAKYQTRKSPAFHAADCKDMTKTGKDGEYISSANSRGVYTWKKVGNKTRKAKSGKKSSAAAGTSTSTGNPYAKAHTKGQWVVNGSNTHPYKVEVRANQVTIYTMPPIDFDYPDPKNYTIVFKKLTAEGVYPGSAPCDPNMFLSPDGCNDVGNTVLIHIAGNKYMYVGREIYEFTIDDEFEAYYSVMTINGSSCPALLGSTYIYLLGPKQYGPRDIFKAPMNHSEWADAEAYYYNIKSLDTGKQYDSGDKTPSKISIKKLFRKIKNIKLVK